MSRILITGGAGFIGSHIAEKHLLAEDDVTIVDNLGRKGSESNLKYLRQNYDFKFVKQAITEKIHGNLVNKDIIYHCAAQTAVTTSVQKPWQDFMTNAYGTLNLLESIRKSKSNPVLFYMSTNKVYGKIECSMEEAEKRWLLDPKYVFGFDEKTQIDGYSPYGCSKLCGDQYVRDCSRIYGLKSIVFRCSCLCGIRQFGIEDQGWIAWLAIAHLTGKKITVYGDGKQVRDVLYVSDLLDAFEKAANKINITEGQIYNIGGGPDNTLSILELFDILKELSGKKVRYSRANERPGDQKIYVSDIRKAKEHFDWRPTTSPKESVTKIFSWVRSNPKLFR